MYAGFTKSAEEPTIVAHRYDYDKRDQCPCHALNGRVREDLGPKCAVIRSRAHTSTEPFCILY